MQNLSKFKEQLSSPKKCVIVMHPKPDADALGSSLGLAGYLKRKGHEVTVISPTRYPDFLKWMNGNERVLIFNSGNEKEALDKVGQADLIFCLDFCSLDRIGEIGEAIGRAAGLKVLIDHHMDPQDFADFNFWSIKAAATAQLVFRLIVDLGDKAVIEPSLADSLYAGIMTDTGSFKHPSTTAEVFETAAQLVECGANVNRVSRLIYDANSVDRLRLIGFALSDKMVVLPEFRTAYFALCAEDLRKYNYQTGDSEGLVNYGLSIKDVVMSATIIEREDGIKFSFRSVGDFSVNNFAKKHFSGGGHKNAAGGKFGDSLEEAIKKFESLLPKYKEQLNK